jgi:hypothetical protein
MHYMLFCISTGSAVRERVYVIWWVFCPQKTTLKLNMACKRFLKQSMRTKWKGQAKKKSDSKTPAILDLMYAARKKKL